MPTEATDYRVDPETMATLKSIVASDDLDDAQEIFDALADDRRLAVMRLLDVSELCVCDLVEVFDIDYSKLSYHLKKLKDADLVTADREGNYVTYRPTDQGETVIEIVRALY